MFQYYPLGTANSAHIFVNGRLATLETSKLNCSQINNGAFLTNAFHWLQHFEGDIQVNLDTRMFLDLDHFDSREVHNLTSQLSDIYLLANRIPELVAFKEISKHPITSCAKDIQDMARFLVNPLKYMPFISFKSVFAHDNMSRYYMLLRNDGFESFIRMRLCEYLWNEVIPADYWIMNSRLNEPPDNQIPGYREHAYALIRTGYFVELAGEVYQKLTVFQYRQDMMSAETEKDKLVNKSEIQSVDYDFVDSDDEVVSEYSDF